MNLQISYREILALARKQIKGVTIEDLKYVNKDTVHVSLRKPLPVSKSIRIVEVHEDTVLAELIDGGILSFLLGIFRCLIENEVLTIEGKKLSFHLRKNEKLAATFNYLGLQEITFDESGVSVFAEAI